MGLFDNAIKKLDPLVDIKTASFVANRLSGASTKASNILKGKVDSTPTEDGGAEKGVVSTAPKDKPDLFEAVQPDVLLNNELIFNPFEFTLEESIDSPIRKGTLTLLDKFGLTEQSAIMNSYDTDKFEIMWANKIETSLPRRMQIGLYDMSKVPQAGNFEGRNRFITFKIFEEPFFTNLFKKKLGDCYQYIDSPDIIGDILLEYVGQEAIKIVKGDAEPMHPSFINPNWTPFKTIKYMQKYGDQGPIKVFNITSNGQNLTVVAPLQKLIANKVFAKTHKMFPSASGKTTGGIRLTDNYVIRGVNSQDHINCLAGHTSYKFDYFSGNKIDVAMPDFMGPDKSKYEFVDDYIETLRSYGSVIGGSYRHGADKTLNTGTFLMHKKETFSDIHHQVTMDVEEKPLVKAKLLNRFYATYYDEMLLEITLPSYSEVWAGQTFDISIPSMNKGSDNETTYDEQLSGDWLLIKIEHKFWTPENEPWQLAMKCYFVKTGLEYSARKLTDKVGSNSTTTTKDSAKTTEAKPVAETPNVIPAGRGSTRRRLGR